jgi:hypothetical protein
MAITNIFRRRIPLTTLLLLAAAGVSGQEVSVQGSAGAAVSAQLLGGDFWVGTVSGPYMLQTHNGTIYPEKPFILVPKRMKSAQPKAVRESIAKAFKTETFDDAQIFIAGEFYAAVLKEHPGKADFIKGERKKTFLFFKKKMNKAIAFRLAKDKTEGSLR